MKDTEYFHQASLVLDILPLVNKDTRFALKGGTAINFFIRPLPRLSVDIDLTYLPIENREITLKNIDKALHELAEQIENNIPEANVSHKRLKEHNLWCAMQVYTSQARIKIEHLKDLPAVKWKLLNLEKMDKKRHEEALTKLVKIFE